MDPPLHGLFDLAVTCLVRTDVGTVGGGVLRQTRRARWEVGRGAEDCIDALLAGREHIVLRNEAVDQRGWGDIERGIAGGAAP